MKTIKVRFKVEIDRVAEFNVGDDFDGTIFGWEEQDPDLVDKMERDFGIYVLDHLSFEGEKCQPK
jgi:hypothetical protein